MNIDLQENYTKRLFSKINSRETTLIQDHHELNVLMLNNPTIGVTRGKKIFANTQKELSEQYVSNLNDLKKITSCGIIQVNNDTIDDATIHYLNANQWVQFTKYLILIANKEANDYTTINRHSNFTNKFIEILEAALIKDIKQIGVKEREIKHVNVLVDLLLIVKKSPKIYSSIIMAALKERKLLSAKNQENTTVADLEDDLGTFSFTSMFFLAKKPVDNFVIKEFLNLAKKLSLFSEEAMVPIDHKKIPATFDYMHKWQIPLLSIFNLKDTGISDLTIKALCFSFMKYLYKTAKKNPAYFENLPKMSFDIVPAINKFLKSYRMLIGAELVKILQENNIIRLTTIDLEGFRKLSVYEIVDKNVSYGIKEIFPAFVFSNQEMEEILTQDPNTETEELINFFLSNITNDLENYYMNGTRDPEMKSLFDSNFKNDTRFTLNRKFAYFWYKNIIKLREYGKDACGLSELLKDTPLLGFLSTVYEIDFINVKKELPEVLFKNILENALDFDNLNKCSFIQHYLVETNNCTESETFIANAKPFLIDISNKIYSIKISIAGLIMQVYILNQFTSFFYNWFSSCNGRLNFIGSGLNPQGFSLSKNFLSFAIKPDRKLPAKIKSNAESLQYLEELSLTLKKQACTLCKNVSQKELMANLNPERIESFIFGENSVIKLSDRFSLYILAYDIFALDINIKQSTNLRKNFGGFKITLHEFLSAYNLDAQASGTQMLAIATKDLDLAIFSGLAQEKRNLYEEVINAVKQTFNKMQDFTASLGEDLLALIETNLLNKNKTIIVNEKKIFKNFQYLTTSEKIGYFSEQINKVKHMDSYIKIKPLIMETLARAITIPEYLKEFQGLHNYYRLEKCVFIIKIYKKNKKIREFFSTKSALKTTILSHAYGSTAMGAKEHILKNFSKYCLKQGILSTVNDLKDLKELIPTVVHLYFDWNKRVLPSSTALFDTISKLCSKNGDLWDGYDSKNNCINPNFYKDPFSVQAYKYSYTIKPHETSLFRAPIKQHVNNNKIYTTYRNETNKIDFIKLKSSFVANLVQCWDSSIVSLTLQNLKNKFPDLSIPFYTNHDCFYIHPLYASLLKPVVASAYEDFYKSHPLVKVFPSEHHKNFHDIWQEKTKNKKFLNPLTADFLLDKDFIK